MKGRRQRAECRKAMVNSTREMENKYRLSVCLSRGRNIFLFQHVHCEKVEKISDMKLSFVERETCTYFKDRSFFKSEADLFFSDFQRQIISSFILETDFFKFLKHFSDFQKLEKI